MHPRILEVQSLVLALVVDMDYHNCTDWMVAADHNVAVHIVVDHSLVDHMQWAVHMVDTVKPDCNHPNNNNVLCFYAFNGYCSSNISGSVTPYPEKKTWFLSMVFFIIYIHIYRE